jgi:hypothetical protein
MKDQKMGGCYGSTESAIVVRRASWRKVFVEKSEPRRKTTNRHADEGRRKRSFVFAFPP